MEPANEDAVLGAIRSLGVRIPLDESDRAIWDFIPLSAVGPLRFGMTWAEVAAALGGATPGASQRGRWAKFSDPALSAYYGQSGTLCCVAVDAVHGPQVTMDGIRLTGRVPSKLSRQFEDYVIAHSMPLVIGLEGYVVSEELGLVLRAQRAGDVLLTRPVFVAREWAYRAADVSEGPIPNEEWSRS